MVFSQVPGKQTVPRSEVFAGAQTLKLLAGGSVDRWHCDASYVVAGARAVELTSKGPNGDLWVPLKSQLDRMGLDAPVKIRAHTSS